VFLQGFCTPSGAEFDSASRGGTIRPHVGHNRQFLRAQENTRPIDTERQGLQQRRTLAGFAVTAFVCRDFFSHPFRCLFDLFGFDRHSGQFLEQHTVMLESNSGADGTGSAAGSDRRCVFSISRC
jgi:hypothetical protein